MPCGWGFFLYIFIATSRRSRRSPPPRSRRRPLRATPPPSPPLRRLHPHRATRSPSCMQAHPGSGHDIDQRAQLRTSDPPATTPLKPFNVCVATTTHRSKSISMGGVHRGCHNPRGRPPSKHTTPRLHTPPCACSLPVPGLHVTVFI